MHRSSYRDRSPVILFTELDTVERYYGWLRYRERLFYAAAELDDDATIAPDPEELRSRARRPPSAGGLVIWRLFSPGHRDVCGSAEPFPGTDAARTDAQRVIAATARLQTVPVTDGRTGEHSWFLGSREGPVVIAHRWSGDHRARDAAARRAVIWLAGARLGDGEALPGWLDPRRLPMIESADERRDEPAGLGAGPTGEPIVDRMHRRDFLERIRPSSSDRLAPGPARPRAMAPGGRSDEDEL